MPPQQTTNPFASAIASSIYRTATAAPPTSTSIVNNDNNNDSTDSDPARTWTNYLYVVIVIALVMILLGFVYQRKRRQLRSSHSIRPHQSLFPFHSHNRPQYPSQSRDLSAVHANHRMWRNIREGPFSHHARATSAANSPTAPHPPTQPIRPIPGGVAPRHVDPDEETPPPYILAEPERTLQRGPTTGETRDAWLHRRQREDTDLAELGGERNRETGEGGKPPGYQQRNGSS